MRQSAGIVLAGGRSSRMGSAKASLEWHGSTLLRRVVGIVSRGVAGPVVVARAPGQALPALPAEVEVVEDSHEGSGPLQGLAAGLAALEGRALTAYVSSTDVPFLHPAFVRRVLSGLGDGFDVAVPHVGGFRQPLSAAYRVSLLAPLQELVAAGQTKPALLLEHCSVRWLEEGDLLADRGLAAADPALDSLRNLNEAGDYAAARALPAPCARIERLGARRAGRGRGHVGAKAATLGQAAAAADVALDDHLVAEVNGDQRSRDPEFPLAAGDTVRFLSLPLGR